MQNIKSKRYSEKLEPIMSTKVKLKTKRNTLDINLKTECSDDIPEKIFVASNQFENPPTIEQNPPTIELTEHSTHSYN